jgi:hypothetical protein
MKNGKSVIGTTAKGVKQNDKMEIGEAEPFQTASHAL